MIDNTAVGDKIIQRFLAEKMEIIVSKFNPEKLILFGSRVWGKPTEESDIDLIIVSDIFKGQEFLGRMAQFLKEVRFSEHIDAICYTPEEFDRKKSENLIISKAVKNGISII
ncbi:MAG: nucleotidyltransferase domain-containing protein [ANME-2 cluster archaeon]|nr:nucleotidyltransferase domain-containing protein [ANME-2 cluster archaeon]MBC2699978.1 nucleotidyltransferase domain-containing protein [ANME-2 cluster archaeon]MBC2709128.1 nucleotidyltransferase domain-containing protein [ANME-2 cluster archaeon]MBC2746894.1 nucleotidyltransferase domain-containing protein [ANME-2 cluster archaeon]MBC2762754.1 nucleotidyltransferase domain-containing protein [ANME-2 cluster archaeon]